MTPPESPREPVPPHHNQSRDSPSGRDSKEQMDARDSQPGREQGIIFKF